MGDANYRNRKGYKEPLGAPPLGGMSFDLASMLIPRIGSKSFSKIVLEVPQTFPEHDLEPILGITIEAISRAVTLP